MRITIGKKLTGGFAVALLILVIIGAITFRGTIELQDDMHWEKHTHNVLANIEHIISALKDAETGQRGFIITGEERYLEPFNDAFKEHVEEIVHVKELTKDNPEQ